MSFKIYIFLCYFLLFISSMLTYLTYINITYVYVYMNDCICKYIYIHTDTCVYTLFHLFITVNYLLRLYKYTPICYFYFIFDIIKRYSYNRAYI